ncbi:MAG: hypothetical protein O2820_15395 [Planctomycetota bacterium]|nr:hypothetical protein [Planctomycetota bacterium]MDA1250601.1 hypothetical protein [Planctomycetota bacterium]
MSDIPATELTADAIANEPAPEPAPDDPFTDEDIRGFESDDIKAGQAITKMLSTLFIYTLIAMSIVSVWTAVVSN